VGLPEDGFTEPSPTCAHGEGHPGGVEAEAISEATVIEHLKDFFWLIVILYIMAWSSSN
jgi:hypothetical protein